MQKCCRKVKNTLFFEVRIDKDAQYSCFPMQYILS